jgi:hypothetical protein
MLGFIVCLGLQKHNIAPTSWPVDPANLIWYFLNRRLMGVCFKIESSVWANPRASRWAMCNDNHGGQHPEPQITNTTPRNQRLQEILRKQNGNAAAITDLRSLRGCSGKRGRWPPSAGSGSWGSSQERETRTEQGWPSRDVRKHGPKGQPAKWDYQIFFLLFWKLWLVSWKFQLQVICKLWLSKKSHLLTYIEIFMNLCGGVFTLHLLWW